MRNRHTAPKAIAALLKKQGRNYTWLAETTELSYKPLLRAAKNGTRPLSLYDATIIADALGVSLVVLTNEDELNEALVA